uniref:Uncharacterized protein n=1 Tax=Neogobius melanostomus TaxID=47308 RepID=A0A8C6T699_9GOBI
MDCTFLSVPGQCRFHTLTGGRNTPTLHWASAVSRSRTCVDGVIVRSKVTEGAVVFGGSDGGLSVRAEVTPERGTKHTTPLLIPRRLSSLQGTSCSIPWKHIVRNSPKLCFLSPRVK